MGRRATHITHHPPLKEAGPSKHSDGNFLIANTPARVHSMYVCMYINHTAHTTGASTFVTTGGLPKVRWNNASLHIHRLVRPDGCRYVHKLNLTQIHYGSVRGPHQPITQVAPQDCLLKD